MTTARELFYFNLYSPDLEKSKVFYKKVLGWDIGGGSLGGHVNNTTTPCGVGPGSTSNAAYFVAENLDTAIALVESNGGEVLSREVFEGIGPAAFCQDSQGTHFALQEPGPPEMKKIATEVQKGCKHGDLFYLSLPVMDEVMAKGFYGAVMGWEFGTKAAKGGVSVENLKGPVFGLGCGREGHYPSLWFRVDDVKKSVDDVKAAGGTAGEIFDAHEGTMSEVVDDQGVKFGIVQPASGY
jgi:predicted enzyme related to lactoylglutathione lyase